ncbi:unnamed protein product [Nesidiocoris tenuis]|uniref:Integrase catalytic domain-containing protein n=1 Tax=Nesidiocoris tenuis TaxID=355587 RepID=A0A6H5HPK5_9HEMI|nr:unnamed protein product [Nesidiocoris tenuis]
MYVSKYGSIVCYLRTNGYLYTYSGTHFYSESLPEQVCVCPSICLWSFTTSACVMRSDWQPGSAGASSGSLCLGNVVNTALRVDKMFIYFQEPVENGDVRDHLNEISDVVNKLGDMDIEIHDDLLSVMILYSLPPSYENFRIAIECQDSLPKPEILKIKILEENEARNKDNNSPGAEGAFLGKNRHEHYNRTQKYLSYKPQNNHNQMSRTTNFQNRDNFQRDHYQRDNYQNKPKCEICKRIGHRTQDCRARRHQESTFKVETCLSSNTTHEQKDIRWCIDSGCTSHMCKNKNQFSSLDNTESKEILKLAATDQTAAITGSGLVKLNVHEGTVNLTNTLFVPTLNTNLLSVSKITDKNFKVIFEKDRATVRDPEGIAVLQARKSNGLYYVNTKTTNEEETNNISNNSEDIMTWHRKMAHINEAELKIAQKNKSLNGLYFDSNSKLGECEVCLQGKLAKLPFPTRETPKKLDILEIVHTDVCGPMRTISPGGARYFVTFIDEASRYCKVYFLKQKSEVLEVFKQYKREAERSTGAKLKYLQSDNGTEYINKEFDNYLKEKGIQRRLSTVHTPQQNGLAERRNRTLQDKARCLLIDGKLPAELWAEAIFTANYINNRTPSRTLNHITPFEKWVKRPPSVRHLHIFGSKVYILNKNPNKGKFDARATEGVFVGYSEVSKAYRIWMPLTRKIEVTRDVRVLKDLFFKDTTKKIDSLEEPETIHQNEEQVEIQIEPLKEKEVIDTNPNQSNPNPNQSNPNPNQSNPNQIRTPRPKRNRKPPERFSYLAGEKTNQEDEEQETEEKKEEEEERKNVNDEIWEENQFDEEQEIMMAFLSNANDIEDGKSEWNDAIKKEIKSHLKNETWRIVDKEPGTNIVGQRMVLKDKLNPDGTLERKKARLVAKGYSQKPGIDYSETFAPVAKLSSIRLILGIAVEKNMKIRQFDVSTAFLNGNLEEKIYMEQPKLLKKYLTEIICEEEENSEIFKKASKMLEDLRLPGEKVCLLQRAVYGLKQAGRQWFRKLDGRLKEMTLTPSEADPCVYTSKNKDVIVAVYVDDIIVASIDLKKIEEFKQKLQESFEIRDIGILNYCLGIEFLHEDGKIKMSQEKYIKELLKKYKMENCSTVTTPMITGLQLKKNENTEELKNYPYQNLIGALIYIAVATRPDISFSVSYLSQFNNCYGKDHWLAAKRILKYLKGTSHLTLTYSPTKTPLQGLSDADWAASQIDRRSYTGYCFQYAGGAISWEARKQKTVALSSTEAEYMCLTEAAKEAVHLYTLSNDLGMSQNFITIFNDNQAAQSLAINPIISNRSKHIDIRQHYIREVIENGKIKLQYRPTAQMTADIFTKPLDVSKYSNFRSQLGII